MSRSGARIIRLPFWFIGIVLIACAFLLVFHLSTNNMDFSHYNTGWNGTTTFFSDLDRHRLVEVYDLKDLAGSQKNSTLLILAPKNSPTPQQLTAYRTFLEGGNTIVVADDFGTGNEILHGLESRITILPGNLSSLDRRYANSYMIVAYRQLENTTPPVPASLALDRPAALDGGTPLMFSSVMSWIDKNGDRRLNAIEDMGMFPVLAYESQGKGRIIVLSDPSILINSMYSQAENADDRELVQNILGTDGKIFVDQTNSRTADASGISRILHIVRTTISIEIAVICIMILGLAWAWKKKIV
jgi:hypothetical protein